jgi:hypothetical protein
MRQANQKTLAGLNLPYYFQRLSKIERANKLRKIGGYHTELVGFAPYLPL